jgi:hypothetical protein
VNCSQNIHASDVGLIEEEGLSHAGKRRISEMLTEKLGGGLRQLTEIRLQLQPQHPHRLHDELLREADCANARSAPSEAAVRLLGEAEACACM